MERAHRWSAIEASGSSPPELAATVLRRPRCPKKGRRRGVVMRRMRSDARCRRRRAVSEGAAVARELGGGGHGGSALVRPERERESEKERDSSGARLRRSRACSSAWH